MDDNITNNDEPRKATHSPPPWVSARYGFNLGGGHQDGFMICTKGKSMEIASGFADPKHYVCEMTLENPNCEADARLISASPDLLEALQAFLKTYLQGANSGDWGNWNPEEEPEIIAARAAIAKALGQ